MRHLFKLVPTERIRQQIGKQFIRLEMILIIKLFHFSFQLKPLCCEQLHRQHEHIRYNNRTPTAGWKSATPTWQTPDQLQNTSISVCSGNWCRKTATYTLSPSKNTRSPHAHSNLAKKIKIHNLLFTTWSSLWCYDVAIATVMDIIKRIALGMHQQSSYHHSNNFNNPENFNKQENYNSYNNRTPTARNSVLVCDWFSIKYNLALSCLLVYSFIYPRVWYLTILEFDTKQLNWCLIYKKADFSKYVFVDETSDTL